MSVYQSYKDAPAYKYFERICEIPHGSGNEKALADYIEAFAKERGLYSYRDSFDNVFIRKEASAGYESRPAVLLQGHIDMVCEKKPEVEFDFLRDGIRIKEKDGCLYADGTTLGADDGAAVAIMLAILDDKAFKAPVIECLFTTSEETSLVGATNFDYSKISARRMINIDTECEGEAVAGSAGGVRCRITRSIEREELSTDAKCAKITLGGLKGGHSGTDIGLGRLSACVAMSKLLKLLGDKITLVSILGGNMDNAIARDCTAVVISADTESLKATASDFEAMLKAKANDEDNGLFITVEESDTVSEAITSDMSRDTIALANEINHGS